MELFCRQSFYTWLTISIPSFRRDTDGEFAYIAIAAITGSKQNRPRAAFGAIAVRAPASAGALDFPTNEYATSQTVMSIIRTPPSLFVKRSSLRDTLS